MGHVIGTLGYMSPEALKGHEIDSTSDVFALGVVLYEMVTGLHPFQEKDATRRVQEIRGGVRWPEEPLVRSDVRALVEHMLAFEQTERATPTAVGAESRQILMGPQEPTAARPISSPKAPDAKPQPEETKSQRIKAGAVSDSKAILSAKKAADRIQPFVTEAQREADLHVDRPTWLMTGTLVGLAAASMFAVGIAVGRATKEDRLIVETVPAVRIDPEPPKPIEVVRSQPEPELARPEPRLPKFHTEKEAYVFGNRALEERRPDEAVLAFREALRLNPAYAQVHRRLGDALVALGDIEGAKASYKMYLALRPTADDAADVRRLLDEI
jgi:serine/threonine-protein kinase